eukprot:15016496-Alexandrium_andersonii.AAC.1
MTIADCNCRQGMYMSATGVCTMCPSGSTTLDFDAGRGWDDGWRWAGRGEGEEQLSLIHI